MDIPEDLEQNKDCVKEKMRLRNIVQGVVITARFGRFFANEIFHVLLFSYLLLFLLEQYLPGFVSYNVNLTWMFVMVVITGIVNSLFTEEKSSQKGTVLRFHDYAFIIMLAITGSILVYIRVKSMGVFSIPLSILSGMVIALLSYLLLAENENNDTRQIE